MGVTQNEKTFNGAYEQSFDPAIFRVAPGVAPKAKLFALKVFGCNGGTDMLGAALERAADPNEDGVFDDRLDVVNTSLGTSYALTSPFNEELSANLTNVGTVFVAAAGNEGQSFYATSSPGASPSVLSVAASVDNEFIALQVLSPPSAVAKYPSAEGGFTTRLIDSGTVSGPLVASVPANGCQPFSNAAAVAGNIVLIDRGVCTFIQKFQNAVAAGAIAGVMVDNEANPLPLAMSGGDPGTVSIPGVLVLQGDGAKLKTALGQGPVTVKLDPSEKYVGVGSEVLADFSSRGPSSVDDRLKPEIAAPGFAIDSARVGSGFEARRSDGTSMACPFVAGAAALVRQAHPEFSAYEVKAALINSTESLSDLAGAGYPTSVVGSGRLAVERAIAQQVTAAADPTTGEVGVSFGAVIASDPTEVKRTFVVENHGSTATILAASVEQTFPSPGISVTVTPSNVTLDPGASATLELVLEFDPRGLGALGPDPGTAPEQYQQPRHYLNEATGIVRLVPGGGGQDVLVPFLGSVRAAAHRKATSSSACDETRQPGDPITIELSGDSAHPEPVVSVFQLGTTDPPQTDPNPIFKVNDILAVGAATNLATAPSFSEASAYFGVVIAGEWTTPARGPLSVVAIDIDSNQDGVDDFEIRAEPLTKSGPYADLLASSTYALSTGEQVGSPHFLDMVDASKASTYPFHNSVLVLSARLEEIGLDAANTSFRYAVTSENPTLLEQGERTVSSTFDAAKPVVDPAKHGFDGYPLFVGDSPIVVDVSADAQAAGDPISLLLLHHTNVAGERFEIVTLPDPSQGVGNVALSMTAPESVTESAAATVELSVTNSSDTATSGAGVSVKIVGGEIVEATPSQGTCSEKGANVDCALDVIEPGKTASVTLSIRAATDSDRIDVSAELTSGLLCESTLSDNMAAVSVDVKSGSSGGLSLDGISQPEAADVGPSPGAHEEPLWQHSSSPWGLSAAAGENPGEARRKFDGFSGHRELYFDANAFRVVGLRRSLRSGLWIRRRRGWGRK